jgi:lipid II:glycine glycyltransferase (peptidoglycan interpeptide bridge formation enzyme)
METTLNPPEAHAPGPALPSPAPTARWKAWDSFLEAGPDTGFMQSSWWAELRLAFGFDHFGAIIKTQGGIIGGALVQRYSDSDGSCFYYIQDGPVLAGDELIAAEVFQAILNDIDEHRRTGSKVVSHLRIEPRWEQLPGFVSGFIALDPEDRFVEARDTLCIDLRPSENEILGQMKPKGRYNIGLARRHGVTVTEDSSERGFEDFLEIYKDTTTRQGLAGKPREYFQALRSTLLSVQRGSIFFAEYQGRRLAAALVVYFGRRATYFYGGSLAKDRHVMAAYLLHFEIMLKARAMNVEWYDFWGVAPRNVENHPWHDFSVFKRKFGGREVNLTRTMDLVYDRAAYDQYQARQRARES